MASKRDFNDAIDRAIQDAERCVADLKRLKSGRLPGMRPLMFVLDLVEQGNAFVRDLNRVLSILIPPPAPAAEDVDGDRHVAIRNRTKRIESKQLALPPAASSRPAIGDPGPSLFLEVSDA